MQADNILTAGNALATAKKALIMIHGRGGSAEDILSLAGHLNVKDFALLAPQAATGSWYPQSFLAPPAHNQPAFSEALELIGNTVKMIEQEGIAREHIYLLGFSQGACLTLEFAARNATRYGGIVAFTGGLIGDKIYTENYKGNFDQTPIFIGTSDPDFHVPVERVHASTSLLQGMGAAVTEKVYKNMGHTITREEIDMANTLIFI